MVSLGRRPNTRGLTTVATALATALIATFVLPSAPPAGAEVHPGFVPGEGNAVAAGLKLAIQPGGSPIEVNMGRSLAAYQNSTATAQGTAFDLGLLTVFFGEAGRCEGSEPLLPESVLPPVTVSRSTRPEPPTDPVRVTAPTVDGSPGPVVGTQHATSAAEPQSSSATTTTTNQDVGLFAVDGLRTTTTTRLDGDVRYARAVTEARQLRILGGLIVLDQPRWDATSRTGGVTTAEGRFTFSRARVLGIDQRPEDARSAFDWLTGGLESLLDPLGVEFAFPEVVVDGDEVTVTPMVFGIVDPPIGRTLVAPLLDLLAPVKLAATQESIAIDCNNAAVLQVVDLVLGVLSGVGELRVEVGGAAAFTAATEYPDPPTLSAPRPKETPVAAAPTAPTPAAPAPLSAPTTPLSTPRTPSLSLPAAPPALPEVPTAVAADVRAADTESGADDGADPDDLGIELPPLTATTTRSTPGSTGGRAVWVGVLGLAIAAAVALGDRILINRTPGADR